MRIACLSDVSGSAMSSLKMSCFISVGDGMAVRARVMTEVMCFLSSYHHHRRRHSVLASTSWYVGSVVVSYFSNALYRCLSVVVVQDTFPHQASGCPQCAYRKASSMLSCPEKRPRHTQIDASRRSHCRTLSKRLTAKTYDSANATKC